MRAQRAVLLMLLSLCAGCGVEVVRRSQPLGGWPGESGAKSVGVAQGGRSEVGRDGARPLGREASDAFDVTALDPRVQSQAKKLSRGRAVRDALARCGRYIDIISRELRREGVPAELAYLPAVESHFSTTAEGAGTVGLWQFTRSTAQRYGLTVDAHVDERRDPERSSRAAARLLRDLYQQFGRWGLALAAYNAGPARVQRALDRHPGADFWQLAERGMLPERTRVYVPAVLAMAAIASEPERFGLDGIKPHDPLTYETFRVDEPLDVKTIAALSGTTTSEIAELNPALRRGVVPKKRGGFAIRLPDGTRERFARNYGARGKEQRAQATIASR